ncbi:acyl carrier protein [Kitasatospora terrestris]|uniref:Carrier domain-containing protein n=1 Tax=Kitasatospora terrestris TaxID=258051 RepID=A0ABP9D8G0_9ACTN
MTPQTPDRTERAALRELFAEVLELDAGLIGDDDDFFRLGGHSQLAIRLAVRVRNRLGVRLTVGDVFAAPTVGSLAGRVADAPKAAPPLRARPPAGGAAD